MLAWLGGRGGAEERKLPQHFENATHGVSAMSLLSVSLFQPQAAATAWLCLIWNSASLSPTSPPCPVWPCGERKGKALLTRVMSITSDNASSFHRSQPASHHGHSRARESCWPWGARWLAAGWVAGRTWLRECWEEWQHLSWLLWLLAREPCDSLLKRVLSTMRHFPPSSGCTFSSPKLKENKTYPQNFPH